MVTYLWRGFSRAASYLSDSRRGKTKRSVAQDERRRFLFGKACGMWGTCSVSSCELGLDRMSTSQCSDRRSAADSVEFKLQLYSVKHRTNQSSGSVQEPHAAQFHLRWWNGATVTVWIHVVWSAERMWLKKTPIFSQNQAIIAENDDSLNIKPILTKPCVHSEM